MDPQAHVPPKRIGYRGSEGEIPKPGPVSIAIKKRGLAHTSTGGPDLALLVVVDERPGSQGM
ncbi:Interferon-Induced Gtp-Binding Protein Mx2 [Manis pentadactyla]|nr:Interferon-Induced Gtp-Binding Protein Mx2 [Manis pentadactyla]